MKNELNMEILAEMLEEIQNIRFEQQGFTSVLKQHSRHINEFNDYLANYEVAIKQSDLRPYVNGLHELYELIIKYFNERQIEEERLKNERQDKLVKRVSKIFYIVIGIVITIVLGFSYIKDSMKYKTIYDYIYYVNPKNREYYNEVKTVYETDSLRLKMRKYIKSEKKRSENSE